VNAVDQEPTRREDLKGLLADLDRLQSIFAGWDEDHRNATEAYRRAIEALHGEALRRLIRALKMDPAAFAAMKQAASDEVVYAVLRHHELIKPSINERIEAALNGIRPLLASHGGDVTLVKVDPPGIEVRFAGACEGCAASALTFQAGVRKAVQEACPEITEVIQVKGIATDTAASHFVSPFALSADGAWRTACALRDIPDGGLHALDIGGRSLALFRHGVAVTCFENACAHRGLPLHEGAVENGIVTCPHHGFRYDLANGACITAPDVQLHPHAVRIVDGYVEVRFSP
jgi:Fe-S cluster biogenesis protein NfuA/nitrite reductase/ring-hydroxylating ferredoxin subunit